MSNQTDQKNMVKLFVILKQVCDYITNVTTGKNAIKLHLFYSSFFYFNLLLKFIYVSSKRKISTRNIPT